MSSYNSVNGAFLGENHPLLTDVLRDEWGYDGFVTSDWVFGVHDGVESLKAGLDVEMPALLYRQKLPEALRQGRISRDLVRASARRIVRTFIKYGAERDEAEPTASVIAGAGHRALAREVAAAGMVLLKNGAVNGVPLLPLAPATKRIAVIGHLATEENMGDHGSSLVSPPSSSTPLDGLREVLPGVQIDYADGTDAAAAAALAASADLAIMVVGMDWDDEGERVTNEEFDLSVFGFPFTIGAVRWLISKLPRPKTQFGKGGDRESLTLHTADEDLIARVVAANPKTVVVTIGGSAILMENWRHTVPAILMAWYPGMEGGRALADVITGAREPAGRLPLSIATSSEHLPFFDAEATSIRYDEWWGQRMLDRDGHEAAYPFGFGLGYTTFEVELVGHSTEIETGVARVRVRNTGSRRGSAVPQLYAADAALPRPIPQLLGFGRVELEPGAETEIEVALDLTPTRQRDPQTKSWSPRPGTWQIVVAQHSPADMTGSVSLAR